jgi:hypothetical protein
VPSDKLVPIQSLFQTSEDPGKPPADPLKELEMALCEPNLIVRVAKAREWFFAWHQTGQVTTSIEPMALLSVRDDRSRRDLLTSVFRRSMQDFIPLLSDRVVLTARQVNDPSKYVYTAVFSLTLLRTHPKEISNGPGPG